VEQPFPLPRLVWRNYWQQWNLFGQPPLGELRDTLDETVVLGQWEGRTLRVHAGPRRAIGFVGTFDYYVRGRPDLWTRLLNLLADYAFYCGTGLATPYGMGQTRRLPLR
jgi:CRISPR-associated endoribonuclease Cas6